MTDLASDRKTYYYTFAALMVLLGLTYGAAYIHLGPFNIIITLTIALAKTLLVVLYFMHMRHSDRMLWVVVVAVAIWLVLLIGGTATDVITRELYEKQILPRL